MTTTKKAHNIFTYGSITLATLGAGLFLTTTTPVSADTTSTNKTTLNANQNSTQYSTNKKNSEISQEKLNKLDKYVVVQNNQYVLQTPSTNEFTTQEIKQAQQMITKANETVATNNAHIDTETKEATIPTNTSSGIATRSAGKNDIKIHWNYARVYLNKNQAKALTQAAISGGSTALGGFFGNIGGAAAGAAIGGYLSSVVGDNFKNGIWVDYNFYTQTINRFGWQ